MGAANQPPMGIDSGKRDHLGGKSMSRRKGVYKLAAFSRGQTMAEYALILVTIAVVAAALVQSAGTILTSLVNNVSRLF